MPYHSSKAFPLLLFFIPYHFAAMFSCHLLYHTIPPLHPLPCCPLCLIVSFRRAPSVAFISCLSVAASPCRLLRRIVSFRQCVPLSHLPYCHSAGAPPVAFMPYHSTAAFPRSSSCRILSFRRRISQLIFLPIRVAPQSVLVFKNAISFSTSSEAPNSRL